MATRRAMLPRTSVKTRSGLSHASWARRRADPVPTMPPAGRSASVLPTRPSRGSARVGTAAITRCPSMVEVQVLGRVHGCVGPALAQRRLHLAHEDALSPDAVERRRRVLVASGAHHDDLDLEPGIGRPQRVGDLFGLAPSQWRAACGQAKRSHGGDYPMARRWGATGEGSAAATRPGGPVVVGGRQTAATGRRGCGGPRPGARRAGCRPSPSTGRWVRAASSPWRRGSRCRPAPTPTR